MSCSVTIAHGSIAIPLLRSALRRLYAYSYRVTFTFHACLLIFTLIPQQILSSRVNQSSVSPQHFSYWSRIQGEQWLVCDEGAERDKKQRFQMSVLNKSGGSTVPEGLSCYITEGAMDFDLFSSSNKQRGKSLLWLFTGQ